MDLPCHPLKIVRWCALVAASCMALPACRNARLRSDPRPLAESAASEAGASPAGTDDPASAKRTDGGSAAGHEPANLLSSTAWVRVPPASGRVAPASRRWRNTDIDPVVAAAASNASPCRDQLGSAEPAVAANAAIVLARTHEVQVAPHLARAIDDARLKLPLRCAAAEAYGEIVEESKLADLRGLVDRAGSVGADGSPPFPPELQAELLVALASHVAPRDEPCFAAALKSPAPAVRVAGLEAWAKGAAGPLPPEAFELASDGHPRVRAAALATLAACRHPEAYDRLRRAMGDGNLEVRLAAIRAMGQLGGDEARRTLEQVHTSKAELSRVAAVTALAAMGARDSVAEALSDKSFRVRQAVADAIAQAPAAAADARERALVAERLLRDASGEVQKQAIKSLETWPLAEAGPLLFIAMEEGSYAARKAAAQQLAARWPEAVVFSADGSPEVRSARLAELRKSWQEKFGDARAVVLAAASSASIKATGASPEQVANMARLLTDLEQSPAEAKGRLLAEISAAGPAATAALEALAARGRPIPAEVYAQVLPGIDPLLATVEQLRAASVADRRRAAAQLAAQAARGPLSALASSRLSEVAMSETDVLVWQNVLDAVAHTDGESASRLASAAAGNASAELRRRACEYFEHYPSQAHLPALLALVSDPQDTVAVAALRAVGATRGAADTAPVVRLLTSPNRNVRFEAAVALSRLGAPEGTAAIERLALDADVETRRRVALAAGTLANPSLVPLLIRLLDDRAEVQQAAIGSLVQIAGRDVARSAGGAPLTPREQAAAWQRWYQSEWAGKARS